jgi:hypothetical protein
LTIAIGVLLAPSDFGASCSPLVTLAETRRLLRSQKQQRPIPNGTGRYFISTRH